MADDADGRQIVVALDAQQLHCLEQGQVVRSFEVSTAARGPGQRQGSLQTPLGQHIVRARIGADLPLHAVLVGRRPTGEIWTPERHAAEPGRDWILTRILWLSGTEVGHNRLGDVDTMRRYIYVHGTPPCEPLGEPASHGCIRMRCDDVIWLFDFVGVSTPVLITEQLPENLCTSVRHR